MAKPQLTFYFDVVSPFAYIAFHVLTTQEIFKQCTLVFVPISLGTIMRRCGNTPPSKIKNKIRWLGKERLYWGRRFSVPHSERMPSIFPTNTTQAQNILCVINQQMPEKLIEVVSAFYHTYFVDLKIIGEESIVKEVLVGVLGEEKAQIVLKEAEKEEFQKVLMENTEKALGEGCFGVPYYAATNLEGQTEHYWGVDRLGQVVDHLGLQRPVELNGNENIDVGGWKALL